MKKTIKLIGIITLIALIGFSMAACSKDKGGGGSVPNQLVGKWSADGTEIFEITSDRKFFMSGGEYEYVLMPSSTLGTASGVIVVGFADAEVGSFGYSISGGEMTILSSVSPVFSVWDTLKLARSGGSAPSGGGSSGGGAVPGALADRWSAGGTEIFAITSDRKFFMSGASYEYVLMPSSTLGAASGIIVVGFADAEIGRFNYSISGGKMTISNGTEAFSGWSRMELTGSGYSPAPSPALNDGSSGFSQPNNYANGNGAIIETKTDGNVKWVIRKHIQSLQIHELASDLDIYAKPVLGDGPVVGQLKLNDKIKITQVAEAVVANTYYYCLNITTDKKVTGWIFGGKFDSKNPDISWRVPYFNNKWEITETIKVGGKSWTVRKLPFAGQILGTTAVNIRDKPGVTGTKVIGSIAPSNNGMTIVEGTEATEEEDKIDGQIDRWLKITYKGVTGWIFGEYMGVERGGAKYWTPETIIMYAFIWR